MKIEELAFKDRKNLAQLNELDLLDIIEFLQNDRKQWVGIFTKTHNGSVEIRKENRELKQKYENAVADYETTMFEKEQLNSLVNSCQEEIRKLKKQVETKKVVARDWEVECKKNISKVEEKETQQKEFIKYLEEKENQFDGVDPRLAGACSGILRKYKSIIGVLDEKK